MEWWFHFGSFQIEGKYGHHISKDCHNIFLPGGKVKQNHSRDSWALSIIFCLDHHPRVQEGGNLQAFKDEFWTSKHVEGMCTKCFWRVRLKPLTTERTVCFLAQRVYKVHLLSLFREKCSLIFSFRYKSETTMAQWIKVRDRKALLYISLAKTKSVFMLTYICLCWLLVCLSVCLSASVIYNFKCLYFKNTWHAGFTKYTLRRDAGE